VSAPRIEIDLALIEHNTRVLVGRLAARDVRVLGITKATLGSPGIAAAMLRGGAVGLGDSRVENLGRLAALDGSVPRTLIRSPMVSQAGQVVRTATASLNTEPAVIAALDEAATQAKTRHDVILMVELGDLREGIAVDDVAAAVQVVLKSPSLRLLGLGANLACQNGVVPDDANMGTLHRLVDQTEARHRMALDVVSSGNSANLAWALTTTRLERTNELRLGEAILLGTEPLHRAPIAGLSTNAFTLVGEVIEVADKPARPWGAQAQAAYGEPPARIGRGTRRQAIVALAVRTSTSTASLLRPGSPSSG
jgi:predicted amino acid racemase